MASSISATSGLPSSAAANEAEAYVSFKVKDSDEAIRIPKVIAKMFGTIKDMLDGQLRRPAYTSGLYLIEAREEDRFKCSKKEEVDSWLKTRAPRGVRRLKQLYGASRGSADASG